jgi:ComF family protein
MQSKNYYLKKILTWLLPYTCILCSRPADRNQDLCTPCYQTLPVLSNSCLQCALPLPDSVREGTCGQCLQKTPPFDVTHALYSYESPIAQLILNLKFNQSLINARMLGELLAHHIAPIWYKNKPLPAMIIPLPLHPARLKERGFNQALEIARPIAKALKIPLNTTQCHRSKPTVPQSTLSAAERQKNVKGAFTVTGQFTGQHVVVIDDVITTGNTVTEFCKTLKQHKAQRVDVWCCARVNWKN